MESFGKRSMSCEQAEALVLDLDRDAAVDAVEKTAALEHVAICPQCAALQESWEAAKEELRTLGDQTLLARAPERVEMRLRQEFRARNRSVMTRRNAAVAAWALAAAAVILGAVSVWSWQHARHANGDTPAIAKTNAAAGAADGAQEQTGENLSADNLSKDDFAEFTPLPGTTLDDTEESAILRVRMQRDSLVSLGFPVNEQRASEWIQVDLLVGNDGLPQAVRLAQEEN